MRKLPRALLRFAPCDTTIIVHGQAAVAEGYESLRDGVAFVVGVELAAYDGAVGGQHSFGAFDHAAACAFDANPDSEATRAAAGAARLSARGAGLTAAHVAHQVFGAIGITLEGPVFRVSRRLRQLASQPPTDAAAREAVLASFQEECA